MAVSDVHELEAELEILRSMPTPPRGHGLFEDAMQDLRGEADLIRRSIPPAPVVNVETPPAAVEVTVELADLAAAVATMNATMLLLIEAVRSPRQVEVLRDKQTGLVVSATTSVG